MSLPSPFNLVERKYNVREIGKMVANKFKSPGKKPSPCNCEKNQIKMLSEIMAALFLT